MSISNLIVHFGLTLQLRLALLRHLVLLFCHFDLVLIDVVHRVLINSEDMIQLRYFDQVPVQPRIDDEVVVRVVLLNARGGLGQGHISLLLVVCRLTESHKMGVVHISGPVIVDWVVLEWITDIT